MTASTTTRPLHAVASALARVSRLAVAAHDAAFWPRTGRPDDDVRVSGGAGASSSAPVTGDPKAAAAYREACVDLARVDRTACDILAASGAPTPFHPLTTPLLTPIADEGTTRPSVTLSPGQLLDLTRHVGHALDVLGWMIEKLPDDRTAWAADALADAGQRVERALAGLTSAAGTVRRPAEVRGCVNHPCPNPSRPRGYECSACSQYRNRNGRSRPERLMR